MQVKHVGEVYDLMDITGYLMMEFSTCPQIIRAALNRSCQDQGQDQGQD